ncbi:MAG: diacylglycerol kinase family protein [Sphingomonadales bacterium]|jgi:diacylglycerol kinase family enzyme
MQPLVAILSNPGSTTNRKSLPAVRAFIEKSSGIFHVEINKFDEIPEALLMCARANPTILVINGGDGTIQATLSALIHNRPFGKNPPPVAVLPGGKTNMIAKDIGMRGSTVRALQQISELTLSGQIDSKKTKRALIGLDLGDGSPVTYGMFFGASGIVSGIDACRKYVYPMKLPNILSHIMTTLLVFFGVIVQGNSEKSFVHAPMTRVQVKGGGYIDGRFLVIMVTTLNRLIMGIDPFSAMGEGKLKFTAIEHSRRTFFRSMLALLFGRMGKAVINGVHYRRSDVIRVYTREQVTLDGEMFMPHEDTPITLDGHEVMEFVGL